MSIQTYQKAATQAESPRDVEFRAFAHVTRGLLNVRETRRADLAPFLEALSKNRMLWSLLAADCAEPGNQLPDALRAGIISLAIFVDRHSSEVARGEGDIEDLIEVNRLIMQGLNPVAAQRDPVAQAG
jgi:flagellar protein FlaF